MSVHLTFEAIANHVQTKAKNVALISISNQTKRNALSPSMMREFGDVITQLETRSAQDKQLVAVIVTGENKTFCSGFDLSSTSTTENPFSYQFAREMTATMHSNLLRLHRLPLVSIAAVDGFALGGGCELMSWCDLRVMANTARAGYLQTKMGVVTGWGGASRLRSLLGPSAALSLLTSPRILTPQECLSRGLITHTSDNENLSAIDIVKQQVFEKEWMDAYPSAIRGFKRLLTAGPEMEIALEQERNEFCALWGGEDNVEAVRNSTMSKTKRSKL